MLKSEKIFKSGLVSGIAEILSELVFPRNTNCIICNSPIPKDNPLSLCRKCFEKIDFIVDG